MYILDREDQHRVLSDLMLIESHEGGWLKRYVDNESKEWTLYYPFPEGHGGGQCYLRKGYLPEDDKDVQYG